MFSMHLLKYAGANEVNSDINNYLHNYDSDNDDCMLIPIKVTSSPILSYFIVSFIYHSRPVRKVLTSLHFTEKEIIA